MPITLDISVRKLRYNVYILVKQTQYSCPERGGYTTIRELQDKAGSRYAGFIITRIIRVATDTVRSAVIPRKTERYKGKEGRRKCDGGCPRKSPPHLFLIIPKPWRPLTPNE